MPFNDRYFDGLPVGAARLAIDGADAEASTLSIQERLRIRGDLLTATSIIQLDNGWKIESIDFVANQGGPDTKALVSLDDGVATLAIRTDDGKERTEHREMPATGILLVRSESAMITLIPALDDLPVGASKQLDVLAFDTFALQLDQEKWTLTRAQDVGQAKAFEGSMTRNGVASALNLSYDAEGVVSFSISRKTGTEASERRD